MFDFWKLTNLLSRMSQPPPIAPTPSVVIHRENKLRLLHYPPVARRVRATPVLIVSSLVNKYYILDLLKGKSYVEYLLSQGFDVYAIDWGTPDDADRKLTLEDYIDRYLAGCAAAAMQHARAKKVSLVGYCMGGTLSLLFAARHRGVAKNLMLLATPVDFHNDSLLSHWSKPANFDVDKFVDRHGNAPVEILQNTFQMLRPAKNITKYADLLEYADNEEYVNTFHAFDYWGNDAVPIAGETFRKFVKDTYQENLLARNEMRLGGKRIDLKQITCPVLNILAEHDPIVPPQSAEVLMNLVGSKDKELLKVKGGHHGISVGAGALKIVYPKSAEWLHKRSGNFRPVEKVVS